MADRLLEWNAIPDIESRAYQCARALEANPDSFESRWCQLTSAVPLVESSQGDDPPVNYPPERMNAPLEKPSQKSTSREVENHKRYILQEVRNAFSEAWLPPPADINYEKSGRPKELIITLSDGTREKFHFPGTTGGEKIISRVKEFINGKRIQQDMPGVFPTAQITVNNGIITVSLDGQAQNFELRNRDYAELFSTIHGYLKKMQPVDTLPHPGKIYSK